MTTTALKPQNYFSTTLGASCTNSDTTIYVNSVPTNSEGYLEIDEGLSSKEIIYYTSVGANFVTLPSVGAGRGVGGTSASSHANGATVKQKLNAEWWLALQNGSSINWSSIGAIANNLITAPMLATSAIKLGYAEITSNFNPGTTAETDVTGVTVTVTVPAGGRDIKITVKADCYNSGAADQITLKIKESSTVLDTAQVLTTAINKVQTCMFAARVSAPSAGSHTYKLTIAGGVANPNIQATSTEKAYILVEAI